MYQLPRSSQIVRKYDCARQARFRYPTEESYIDVKYQCQVGHMDPHIALQLPRRCGNCYTADTVGNGFDLVT
jgi:hypothetical protein